MYATPDGNMIARMLHLPPDKNKLLLERDAHRVQDHTAEYVIDNRMVYDILDEICKDTDLHLYVKQHKSKRDGRGAFYAIHSRWLGPNHVNATASEAEMALQMSTYDGERGIELGKVCSLPCQVSYYPCKPHGIWVPRS